MYKIVVRESRKADRGNGKVLAAENCRISALSSADYCLRDRREVAWGRIAWKGSAAEIRRLFDAERLNDGFLNLLEEGRDYVVIFLGTCLPACA